MVANRRFHMGFWGICSLIAWIGVFASIAWISSASAIVPFLLAVFFYALVAYVLSVIFRVAFRSQGVKFLDFLALFVRRSGILMFITIVTLGGFAVYQNHIDPAPLATYTISNGTKTVVYRAMSHIGSEWFYSAVRSDIQEKKKEWYALFFEWVRPGTPENMAKFDQLLGFRFSVDLYPVMSKLYGLRYQKNSDFLGFSGGIDHNADVSIDDLIRKYEAVYGSIPVYAETGSVAPVSQSGALAGTDVVIQTGAVAAHPYATGSLASSGSLFASGMAQNIPSVSGALSNQGNANASDIQPIDIAADMQQLIDMLSPRELEVIRYINRAIMSFIIKNSTMGIEAASSQAAPGLFDLILQERNRHLVSEIESSKETRIIVTYGALHFDGVFDLLQEHDPRWKIAGPIVNVYPTVD